MLEGCFQRDLQFIGDELCQPVHLAVGNVHGSAHVFDRSLGRHRAKRDDLRDVFAAVFLGHILDHFAAAAHAEVDIDIGQRNPLRVEEPLEDQVVLKRINIGDAKRVTG